jgi:hypothetical protein
MNPARFLWMFLFLGAPSAQVSLLERVPGQAGDVLVLGVPEPRPPALQGIYLDPLELVGRTRLTELLPDQPRLRTDVPGASRIVLPGQHGSLYKYRRRNPDLTLSFGYFRIGSNGIARTLLELPGTGASGATDPLPGRVAVAADGRAFLVASTLAAGGDLWEVDLVTGTAHNRTPTLEPKEFGKNGLALLPDWGLAVARDGVLRFGRVLGEEAAPVSMPVSVAWHGPDLVHSRDGSTVAFVAGASVARAWVFTSLRTGAAVQASEQPMRIQGAGFLPEDPSGPSLALSTDGSWVVWRMEDSSRECFARQTRGASRPPDLHLTGPTTFDNTLNDTGVIAFFDPDSLVLVAGRDGTRGIRRADAYRLDLTPSGFATRNLSLTSGLAQPPYDYGALETEDGLFQVPGPVPAFLARADGSADALLWVSWEGGSVRVLERVEELHAVELAGTYLVADVTRPPGVNDPLLETLDLVQIPPGGSNPTVVRLPDGCHLSRRVGSSTRPIYAAVLELPGGERLGQLRVPSPAGIALSPALDTFGPTTGMAADGSILATVSVLAHRAAFSWSGSSAQVLRVSRLETVLLPGL